MKNYICKCFKLAVILIAISPLVACHRFNPSSAFNPNVSFASMDTYAWLPGIGYERSGIIKTQPAIGISIKSSIEQILEEKGYQKVKREPDFYVVYHAAIETDLSTFDLNRFYTSPFGPKNTYWENWSDKDAIDRTYKRGSIIIDVIQRDDLHLIWRGSTYSGLYIESKHKFDQSLTEESLRALFKKFPPQKSRSFLEILSDLCK